MSDNDDHVIPYEEAVRRHREREAEKRKGVLHEVKISDAMVHLLEGEAAQVDEGPSPIVLRRIVEREFSEDELEDPPSSPGLAEILCAAGPGGAGAHRHSRLPG